MTIWSILGIPRTTDRAAIRRAYAKALRATNPEDDAEGFKALRGAYEAALAYADNATAWNASEDEADGAGVTMAFSGAEFSTLLGVDVPAPDDADPPEVAQPRFRSEHTPNADAARDPADLFAARDAEIAAVRALIGTLAGSLRGPWDSDDSTIRNTFAELLATPAMAGISLRGDVEQAVAELLAATIPRSDVILLEAATAFDWQSQRPSAMSPAVAAVIGRLDEWRLIKTISRGPLRPAWRSLTRRAGPYWLWRLAALTPGLESGVATLLGAHGPVAPGLAYSFKADAVVRWQRLLGRPHWTLGMLAAMPLALLLSFALGDGFAGPAPALQPWANWAIDLAILFSPCVPYAARRLRYRWLRAPRAAWLAEGWPAGPAAVLFGAMLLPESRLALAALTVVTALAWVWMAVAGGSATIEAVRNRALASVLPVLGGALFGGGWAAASLDPVHRAGLALVLALGAAIMVGPLAQAGEMLGRVPRWRAAFAAPVVLAIGGVAYGAALLIGVQSALFYAATLTLVAGYTVAIATQIAGVRGNGEHLALRGLKMVLIAGFVFAALTTLDDEPRDSAAPPSTGEAMPMT